MLWKAKSAPPSYLSPSYPMWPAPAFCQSKSQGPGREPGRAEGQRQAPLPCDLQEKRKCTSTLKLARECSQQDCSQQPKVERTLVSIHWWTDKPKQTNKILLSHKREQGIDTRYKADGLWTRDSHWEARHKRPQNVSFHLCEMLRTGISTETDSEFKGAGDWGRTGSDSQGVQGFFRGNENILKSTGNNRTTPWIQVY